MNRKLTNEELAEYKDARWQKRKAEILHRDKYTCQICGRTAEQLGGESQLHVHHTWYGFDCREEWHVWDARDWQLITLCDECHEMEHWIAPYEITDEWQSLGVTRFEMVATMYTWLTDIRHNRKNMMDLIYMDVEKNNLTNSIKYEDENCSLQMAKNPLTKQTYKAITRLDKRRIKCFKKK